MPLYEYQCLKCGKKNEKIETVAGPHLKKCPHCGGRVERLQSAPAIQFKGSGWYVTDYAGKSKAKEAAAPDSAAPATPEKKDSTSKESASKESSPKETKEKKPSSKK
ncbi:MAG TPA: zinc ribbon domain-containing protein [Candidatus Acidoferrum sp.]